MANNLPPDPEGMNEERSEWADAAIQKFMEVCRTEEGCEVRDLLSDMMHWCDRRGFDFNNELQAAKMHYEEETYQDEEEVKFWNGGEPERRAQVTPLPNTPPPYVEPPF